MKRFVLLSLCCVAISASTVRFHFDAHPLAKMYPRVGVLLQSIPGDTDDGRNGAIDGAHVETLKMNHPLWDLVFLSNRVRDDAAIAAIMETLDGFLLPGYRLDNRFENDEKDLEVRLILAARNANVAVFAEGSSAYSLIRAQDRINAADDDKINGSDFSVRNSFPCPEYAEANGFRAYPASEFGITSLKNESDTTWDDALWKGEGDRFETYLIEKHDDCMLFEGRDSLPGCSLLSFHTEPTSGRRHVSSLSCGVTDGRASRFGIVVNALMFGRPPLAWIRKPHISSFAALSRLATSMLSAFDDAIRDAHPVGALHGYDGAQHESTFSLQDSKILEHDRTVSGFSLVF